ncbi:MAG: GNAT family N-acetyltransferase [Desulfobulbaceae bacterium]|nr:GNAT family N-acetyltransferase [Desulfobulbaceae bacterium]
MLGIRICEDPVECQQIWEKAWPQRCLFDLWPVRDCFASSYKRPPCFLVAERDRVIEGIMALSWVNEEDCYMHFPGETWDGKTWIEQNKIPARSSQVFAELLGNVPGLVHLRYLTRDSVPLDKRPVAVDEVGYLFVPRSVDYSFQTYLHQFSGKSRKKLSRELAALENHGVAYRYDHVQDIQWLFRMNLESFQQASYFYDPRFLDSVDKLAAWLHGQGMLRITTLLLGGKVAAVDIGAVSGDYYTVLAGATNPEFPGAAKMINFHHLEWACLRKMEVVDFLCGDFGWKQRFHLIGRPLYEMQIQSGAIAGQEAEPSRMHACEQ